MIVKFILPALTEATDSCAHSIKYSLFPPLGLATLAGYLDPDDTAEICDEHVQRLRLDDRPDLVAIEVYVTSARRSYQIADHYRAKGVHVALGGLHATAMPDQAAEHADTLFLGPGEDTWPRFLADFRRRIPGKRYISHKRSLDTSPPTRRDLIDRSRYLVPNSIVVSRGCPHHCDFCYKDSFFQGGKSFYVRKVDHALAEINALPGRHLFFLDDHLFAHSRFASDLFTGMKGMNRLWQSAGTVGSVLDSDCFEKAVTSGLKSLFIGFETLNSGNLIAHNKDHNLNRNYTAAIRRLHDHGVMINASFVFGMDGDDPDVFERTVDWALENGVETATFHILTPYPGTVLHSRMQAQNRILTNNLDLYDTRHCVFEPALMSPKTLEAGYWRAYKNFYRWSSIIGAARTKPTFTQTLRHFAYTAGWKKLHPLWNIIIKTRTINRMRPLLEYILRASAPHEPDPVQPQVITEQPNR